MAVLVGATDPPEPLPLGLFLWGRLVACHAVVDVTFFGLAEIEDAASALAVGADLNAGRIVVRMAHDAPRHCPESYEESLKGLPQARRHADDFLVFDNTPNGRGHRFVTRFIAGELVKVTRSSPDCLKDVFGRELRAEGKQQEKPARGR